MTIWLIGMMGSGKTTVGRAVAARLGLAFHDTDLEVEERAGRTISEIWEEEGEAAFRQMESDAVARLAGSESVVATGGGVVLDPANRATMRSSGRVFWLDGPPELLAGRVGQDEERPLLGNETDAVHILTTIRSEREEAYEAAAHHRLGADEAPDEVAAEVVRLWKA